MVDRDKVDYRDKTPFDQDKLQDLQTIKEAILRKQYGKDVRASIAQLPDALIKLFSATGGDANAEVMAARGGFETLGLHEQAQDNAITGVSNEVADARTNNNSKKFMSLKDRLNSQEKDLDDSINDKLSQISSIPEAFANLSALQSKYPTGKAGIFVVTDTGHKYIWSNGSWLDAGVYQSVGIPDQSINPAKLSLIYDLQGDGILHNGEYIVGYDTNNKIVLQKSDTTPYNTLEIHYNKSGIVHVKKSSSHVFGQAVMITDLQNKLLYNNYYDYESVVDTKNQSIDYFVYVTDEEILINLDRISEASGNDYKVWISYPQDITSIPLTLRGHNGFRNYLN